MTIPLDLFDPYPSRDEVDNWSWEHLEALVETLTAWMTQQVTLRQMHMFNMKTPGGTDWHGDANDAAVDLASNDTNKVMAEVAVAAKARQIAMDAIAEQMQLKGIAEDAIEQVEAQGFSVQPDWTPKDLKYIYQSEARKTYASESKQDLILRAQALQLADRETTRQLGQQMAAMRKEQFSQTGRFEVQPVDNKTPKPDPDQQAQPSQTHALDHKDKPAVPAPGPQPDPAARFGSQPRLDPSTPEGRKQLEDIRQQMQGPASPVAPPLATSGGPLQGVPVAPSVPRPEAPIPPPAPPGFMDGVAAAASDMVNHLADTTGFHGSEAAKQAWVQNMISMFKAANPIIAAPVDAANMLPDRMSPQSPTYLAGKQAFNTWFQLSGLALPEAGALGRAAGIGSRAGALDGTLGRLGRAPVGEPRPPALGERAGAAPAERPAEQPATPGNKAAPAPPSVGDTGAPGRPEFTLANPLDQMSPEMRHLSEQHLTNKGETVLGPYTPRDGGPSYIDVAKEQGASYFDIGDAWNSATPTERLAANQHVLDVAIERGDTIKLSVPVGKIDPNTFTGAELRYLEAHGYRFADSTTMIPPSKGAPR